MKWKKPRKPRGKKLDGTRSRDMCSYCIAFNCDPMGMSRKFTAKVDRRREAGQCPSCGHNPCTCKSSLKIKSPIMMFKKSKN